MAGSALKRATRSIRGDSPPLADLNRRNSPRLSMSGADAGRVGFRDPRWAGDIVTMPPRYRDVHFNRGRLLRQDLLVDRVRGPSVRRRVEDMYRNRAIADDADVLRRPGRAEPVGGRAHHRARRQIELQSPWIAERGLDRD